MSPSGSGWAHPCQLYSWPAGTTCAPQRGWGGRNKGLGPAGKGEEDYSLCPSSLNLPLYRRGIWGAQHLLKALAVSFIPLGHRPPTYLPIMRSTRAPSQISRDFLAPRSCLRLHFFPLELPMDTCLWRAPLVFIGISSTVLEDNGTLVATLPKAR